jgi:receptor protein-tyrosine kinase
MNSIEKLVDRMLHADSNTAHTRVVAPQTVAAPAAHMRGNSTSNFVELDLARLKAAGMLTPDNSRSVIAEEYRAIKRPLLKNAFNSALTDVRHPNLIMVTSALPGEGKSFTSVNLAISIAMELDHTVLLVEGDVAKPAMARYLGLPEDVKGLVDFLSDEQMSLDEVLLRTNVPKLTLLRSGRPHQQATELLASQHMSRLIEELAQRYSDRVVIFDAPPMLVSSEAAVLASLVGQIVMVVEYGKTPQSVVKDALKLIGHDKIVGIVLNKSQGGSSQGYGYGYYGISGNGRE